MLRTRLRIRTKLYPTIAFACLLSGASLGQSIKTSYAPGTDFSKYHTYTWVEVSSQNIDPALEGQIKQSIDSQLAAKGLRKADSSADLSVDYQTAVSKVEKWETYEDWSDISPVGGRLPKKKKITIDVGTLVVDMYDTAGKRLVWNGRASKAINLKSSPEDRKNSLDKTAKELLAEFPPK